MEFSLSQQDSIVWYFAYGSNMSSAKFTGGRGIQYSAMVRVRIPGWTLTMSVPGLPYSEPAFSSIEPLDSTTDLKAPEVTGVAYRITKNQYKKVIGSEGGGIAYLDIAINAVPVSGTDESKTGSPLRVRTLQGVMERTPPGRPSKRYMDIIVNGAEESQLSASYRRFLAKIPVYGTPGQGRRRIGAMLFLTIWGPVMALLEKITIANLQEDGNVPPWVTRLVRSAIVFIWLTHDWFFAPTFGRGDGLDVVGEDEELTGNAVIKKGGVVYDDYSDT